MFDQIATGARRRLSQIQRPSADAFASINSFTMSEALETLDRVGQSEREACDRLAREPAIARVVAEDEEGKREVYYISRVAAHSTSTTGARFASYRSPVGRLAALPLGGSVDVPRSGQSVTLEVIERATLRPEEKADGWDALSTVFETETFGPITIESLRWLISRGLRG